MIIAIGAVILVLLFLGLLFLVMILYFNNRKGQLLRERQLMKIEFERQLLEARLEMQEHTFNFISEEIHDNVGQVLSLAKVQLNIMDQKPVIDRSMIGEVKISISKALTELRDIARSLSTERIRTFDLVQSVEEEVKRIQRSGLISASLDVQGVTQDLGDHFKIILFRLIQECLQNIVKHAQASELFISIDNSDHRLTILIRDNGVGFDVETQLQQNSGLGLKNMINRAKLIGGQITIRSAPGNGTTTQIQLPYG